VELNGNVPNLFTSLDINIDRVNAVVVSKTLDKTFVLDRLFFENHSGPLRSSLSIPSSYFQKM